jgi:8-amino-7-oxononanoate synthase
LSVTDRLPSFLAGRTIHGAVSARINIDGRDYINFFGSGYLALSNIAQVRNAVLRTLQKGAPFAQPVPAALGAIDPIFAAVERAGAMAFNTEATVFLPSGYLIGCVGLSSFDSAVDVLMLDEFAHHNLVDAAKISGLNTVRYRHCDPQSLHDRIKSDIRAGRRPLVMTDGVFATTGRIAPLAEYSEVLKAYDGRMFVDESHSFGVVGPNGRGAAEYCGVQHLARIGATLSKALCAQGALVGCSTNDAQRLKGIPPMRGACAGSPLSAVAATEALTYAAAHPELAEKLRAIAERLRSRLRGLGLEVINTPAPIVSFGAGNIADMRELQRRAFESGVFIYHSTYLGAGPEGVIRCAVFCDHSPDDIDALISVLS